MPQAIALAIISAVGASGLAAAAITLAVYVGFSVGVSLLMQAIFGPTRPKPSDGQIIERRSVMSRRRNYGIVHNGDALTFEESSNGTIARVITLGTGQESDILEHRINDQVVTLDGTGTVTQSSFHGAVHIYTRDGADDQTAIAELTAKFPQWTVNHRQRGCAHVALIGDPVKQERFSEVYQSRLPDYTQVRKGVRLYDPRKDDTAVIGFDGAGAPIMGAGAHRIDDPNTREWSDNAALVIGNYVGDADGYGLGYDLVNWTNIAGEADICDETVTTVTEETIARWRIWASYKLAEEQRSQILSDMLNAVDGFCWQGPDFKFNLQVGRYEAPDIVITDDHILTMSATLGPDSQQRVSALKMLYTEASIGYREQESATVSVPGAEEDPNTDPQNVQLYYAPHHNQAVRVGKIQAARLGDRWRLQLTLNLYGLMLIGRRFCRVTSAALGIDAEFIVEGGVKLKLAKDSITISANLTQVTEEDWNFDAATEEGTPPISPDTSTTVVTVPVPTGLTLDAVQIVLASGNGVAIEATWDAGRADLIHQVRYRPSAGGTWQTMSIDEDANTARSGPVDSGVEYEVQIRAITITYRTSDWSASELITPTADTSVPAPTALSATGGSGSAGGSFSMPSGASVAYVRLYHNDSNDFGTATQVGSDITASPGALVPWTDSGLSAGTEYYWARAFDGSGGSSTLAGPVTATIS